MKKNKLKIVVAFLIFSLIAGPIVAVNVKNLINHNNTTDVSEITFNGVGKDAAKSVKVSSAKFPDSRVIWGFYVDDVETGLDGIPKIYHVEKVSDLEISLYPLKSYENVIKIFARNLNASYEQNITLKVANIPVTGIELDQNSINF